MIPYAQPLNSLFDFVNTPLIINPKADSIGELLINSHVEIIDYQIRLLNQKPQNSIFYSQLSHTDQKWMGSGTLFISMKNKQIKSSKFRKMSKSKTKTFKASNTIFLDKASEDYLSEEKSFDN